MAEPAVLTCLHEPADGLETTRRCGAAGMSFHRKREQPLKGEAQERSRSETWPARLDREKTVERVTKPCGRIKAGRLNPRKKWIGLAESAVGQKTSRESSVAERRPTGDDNLKR